MLDFICMGSADLFGTGRERKIKNENICLQWDSNPRLDTPRQVNQRFRPLGHDTLMMICGLKSFRIVMCSCKVLNMVPDKIYIYRPKTNSYPKQRGEGNPYTSTIGNM